jgi:hypothetical protein
MGDTGGVLGVVSLGASEKAALHHWLGHARALVCEWVQSFPRPLNSLLESTEWEPWQAKLRAGGSLSREDLERVIRLSPPKWYPLTEALVALGDLDGDGCLSGDELRALCAHHEQPLPSAPPQQQGAPATAAEPQPVSPRAATHPASAAEPPAKRPRPSSEENRADTILSEVQNDFNQARENYLEVKGTGGFTLKFAKRIEAKLEKLLEKLDELQFPPEIAVDEKKKQRKTLVDLVQPLLEAVFIHRQALEEEEKKARAKQWAKQDLEKKARAKQDQSDANQSHEEAAGRMAHRLAHPLAGRAQPGEMGFIFPQLCAFKATTTRR